MAAVIHSHPTMIATQHYHHHDASYRSTSRPRASPNSKRARSDSATAAETPRDSERAPRRRDVIPSPPSSSSPAATATDNVKAASMASTITSTLAPAQQQPSPVSDDFQIPPTTATSAAESPSQTTIHVRDLDHVRTLARTTINDAAPQTKYEISAMPIGDIIEMVAALLTKITTTNDLQHDAMQRNVAHQQQASQSGDANPINPMSHSVLAFHGKNVPAITIHSYLARIHKYCPTTFEVFLSLLVYFDRMTEQVNDLVSKSDEARRLASTNPQEAEAEQPADVPMRDGKSAHSDETDSDLADDDDEPEVTGKVITGPPQLSAVNGPSTYFVVDSFNIHRLIIAGVTCSSKFFSDVFYTNSRYAKVGGLPLAELNHLELQFLVLNGFRLSILVEDLEAYATMLVEFYAREVVGKKTEE